LAPVRILVFFHMGCICRGLGSPDLGGEVIFLVFCLTFPLPPPVLGIYCIGCHLFFFLDVHRRFFLSRCWFCWHRLSPGASLFFWIPSWRRLFLLRMLNRLISVDIHARCSSLRRRTLIGGTLPLIRWVWLWVESLIITTSLRSPPMPSPPPTFSLRAAFVAISRAEAFR